MSEDRPEVFLSFNDLSYEAGLAGLLKKFLGKRGIECYILTEDARIGEDWVEAASRRMLASDGVILIWTARSKGSNVEKEYRFIQDRHLPLALIREPGVELPEGYPEGRVYIPLNGYSPFVRVGKLRILGGRDEPGWSTMVNQLTIFAWRNSAKKALAAKTPSLESFAAGTKLDVR